MTTSANFEDLIGYGLHSARPTAGVPGRLFSETDTGNVYRDNGSSWDLYAVRTGGGAGSDTTAIHTSDLDTDGTLAANSDAKVATQKAVKTYADQLIAAGDAMVFKGVIDCSGNPNYPAADRGHTYRVSVSGKIGGASGLNVEAGDILICLTDSTASGTQAGVGSAWSIAQANLDGAVIGPASVTDGHVALFDGTTGKLIKDGGALGGGSIGGATGSTDNAVIRADGTGGATVQNSLVSIDDSGSINIPTGQTFNVDGSPHTHAGGGGGADVLGVQVFS